MFSDLHNRPGFGFRGNATINSTPITFPSTKRPRERLDIAETSEVSNITNE